MEVLGTVRATVPDGKRVLGTVLLSDTIPVNLEWDLAATEKIEELPLDEVLRGVSSYLADKTHLNFIPSGAIPDRVQYAADRAGSRSDGGGLHQNRNRSRDVYSKSNSQKRGDRCGQGDEMKTRKQIGRAHV